MSVTAVRFAAAVAMLAFPIPVGWPAFAVASHATEMVGPGVAYDRWSLTGPAGPLVVHVTSVDLRDPSVSLGVVLAHDRIGGTGEALSSMADRAGAEAAINGDYFDIEGTGIPANVVVEGGRILHEPDGAAALFVGRDGSVTFGPMTYSAVVADANGASLTLDDVDDWTAATAATIVTPDLGPTAAAGATEVVLSPASSGDGYIVSARGDALAALMPLSADELAIAAHAPDDIAALGRFAVGDAVTVTTSAQPDLGTIATAVGGGPLLLKGGSVYTDPLPPAPEESKIRYPVSGAGVSADGRTLWLVAVDGEDPQRSAGITRPMLASLFAALGASDAIALDSGGSTEMAIRHLGDTTLSVMNRPSDGRERDIADALVVRNTATPGPVSQLLLSPAAASVLAGSHANLQLRGVDANDQPIEVAPGSATFSTGDPSIALVDQSGVVAAQAAGATTIRAAISSVPAATTAIRVVSAPADMTIGGIPPDVATGGSARLSLDAEDTTGAPVSIDPPAIVWAAAGGGKMTADGTFVAGTAPAIATVTAFVAGIGATATIDVGTHDEIVAALPVAGSGAAEWRFFAESAASSGSVDGSLAPDGSPGLHLDYAFAPGEGTRAAYAVGTVALPGTPMGVSVDVFGDGGGEWLRAAYRDATGSLESVTLARHVDWRGWKTVFAPIATAPGASLVVARLYVVEPNRTALDSGDLWFRNIAARIAGPAEVAPSPTPQASPYARPARNV